MLPQPALASATEGTVNAAMIETSRIDVDFAALEANLLSIRGILPDDCRICAVVKANGYGLGAVPVAKRLAAAGVGMLAVYDAAQAAELAHSGINVDLLVLMPVTQLSRTDTLYRTAVAGRLHLTVHSLEQIDAVERIGQAFGTPMPVHLEVDTGMSRCGMTVAHAEQALHSLAERRYLRLAGLFTHPASADGNVYDTARQLSAFDGLVERTADCIPNGTAIHFANTHALLRDRAYHKTMVRLGLSLYGYGQHDLAPGPVIGALGELRPVMRWLSRIVHTLDVPAGTPVGYGGTFTTWRGSRLGIVPVGYADGYPLSLSNKSVVRVGEQLAPAEVRGKVNMDQLIVDLTTIPDVDIDSEVEVYSDDPAAPNALHVLAEKGQTSCYELLCRLSPKLTRRYVTADPANGRQRHVSTSRSSPEACYNAGLCKPRDSSS